SDVSLSLGFVAMRTIPAVIPFSALKLECEHCGAEARASCNCGVAYRPAKIRAKEAIDANPQKSDRSIAKELGISPTTVGEARQLSSTGQLDERVGLDGKTRRIPVRAEVEENAEESPADRWQRSLSNMAGEAVSLSSYWTREFGK